MINYNHQELEEKWRLFWKENNVFFTNLNDASKPKKYILSMFPYPSSKALHVGHVRNYTIADAIARFFRLKGYNVLHPMGWDALGLPGEQAAIQTNNHPSSFTQKNIETFKEQLLRMGFSYDWQKEINTSDPKYYHWTQWIFCQMYRKGLAEYQERSVYWCPQLGTVLANEEIQIKNDRRVSERGNYPVLKKKIWQWSLRITDYAERLLDGLSELDWPEKIIALQRNWIGLTNGTIFNLIIENSDIEISVFTTRPDTIIGATVLALSTEHKLLKQITLDKYKMRVEKFCQLWQEGITDAKKKPDLFGQFLGVFVINPIDKISRIPVYVTNFVVSDYGTGAVMLAPFFSSDDEWEEIEEMKTTTDFFTKKEKKQNKEIDFKFSKDYNLLKSDSVIKFKIVDGKITFNYKNSIYENVNGKDEAVNFINNLLKRDGIGRTSKMFHLKNWSFSRQRFWGEPTPVIHLENGEKILLKDEDLPLLLPHLDDFSPDSNFYAPLEKVQDWVKVKVDGLQGKRDVNVMTQFAASSWYYIAFLLRKGTDYLAVNSSRAYDLLDKWLPVDIYVGGAEHANLHLLYARFWHKFLYDIKIVSTPEPFKKLICQGIILGTDGEKMSKSRQNTIDPDFLIKEYGADALRLYVIFLGPIDKTVHFNSTGVKAMKKWLNRVYDLFMQKSKMIHDEKLASDDLKRGYARMIDQVQKYYQQFKLNLVVSSLMIFINECYSASQIPLLYLLVFCQLLSPLAPYISEELWSYWKEGGSIAESLLLIKEEDVEMKITEPIKIIVQLNGKKKMILELDANIDNNELLKRPEIVKMLIGRKIVRTVMIEKRLINFVCE